MHMQQRTSFWAVLKNNLANSFFFPARVRPHVLISSFQLTPVQERYWPLGSLQYESHQGSHRAEAQDVPGEIAVVPFDQYGESRLWEILSLPTTTYWEGVERSEILFSEVQKRQ